MLIDARSLQLQTIEKDVCIIGSGPAGISLAREFIGCRLDVALIESGGLGFDPAIQSLADGPTYGRIRPSVEVNHRQFGGNANIWSVRLGPREFGLRHAVFDEIDFVKRDWIPNSGWPFGRDLLVPYYERAQVVCHAGPYAYSPECWEDSRIQRWPLQDTDLETSIFQFSAGDVFYKHYRDELIATKNISIYTYATAVELIPSESRGAVNQARIARPGGRPLVISAKAFILAAGGFENARLLLMSNRQQGVGLGNQHDLVGRYYHDHLQGRSGYFIPADPQLFNRTALYDLHQVNGTSVMGYLKLSNACMEREKLLNINCFLLPRPNQRQEQAIESFNELRRKGPKPEKKVEPVPMPSVSRKKQLLNVVLGLDYVAKMGYLAKTHQQSTAYNIFQGGWSQLRDIHTRFKRFEVWHSMEQSPQPENRITLSQERDVIGCPKLEVHWHWPQDDINQTLKAQNLIAKELERAGLGKYQLDQDREEVAKTGRHGSHHLMGTTRMHDNPKQGVVDANCRVHGINNLFVAGSSTFPTGGYANPTLTIVAMALRLGDLLKQELAAPSLSSVSV